MKIPKGRMRRKKNERNLFQEPRTEGPGRLDLSSGCYDRDCDDDNDFSSSLDPRLLYTRETTRGANESSLRIWRPEKSLPRNSSEIAPG